MQSPLKHLEEQWKYLKAQVGFREAPANFLAGAVPAAKAGNYQFVGMGCADVPAA
jgi:hypothetical protein